MESNNNITGVDVLEVKQPADITMQTLSEKDQQAVRDYASKIDVTNASEVLQYGSTAQAKMQQFADTALESVRNKDTGVVGQTLTDLVSQLEGFKVDTGEKKGFMSLFRRASHSIVNLKTRYDKVSVSVDQVANTLEDHRVGLLKDIAMLDRLYDENVDYYRQLAFYIVAGRERIDTLRNTEVPKLREKASETGDPVDAQALNDMESAIDRFEKKIYDLELTRQISIQMAPQIRLLQNNDSLMADKIHSTLVNTLPLWKSQMVLALGLENSRAAIAAQQAVTDATNKMLRENAEVLKQGTIETAKATERGIVDIETLTETNRKLIESLNEVENIQREGREQRAAAEKQLRQMEEELKQKLVQVRDRSITDAAAQQAQTENEQVDVAPRLESVSPMPAGTDAALKVDTAKMTDEEVFSRIGHTDASADEQS